MKVYYFAISACIQCIKQEDYPAYYLSNDINFILPRAHTLISLMSYYDDEQGSELSGTQLKRVSLERHWEWSLAANVESGKIKAKYVSVRVVFLLEQATILNQLI